MAGYIGKSQGVTQVDGYNRSEADAEFVQVAGDTMTGALAVNGNLTVDTDTLFVDAASNNVGIGTSSPSFDDGTGVQVSRTGTATYRATNTSNSVSLEMKATNTLVAVSSRGNYPLLLETNGTERARIDASGNLLVGTTSADSAQLKVRKTDASGDVLRLHNDGAGTGVSFVTFRYGAGQTEVGYISTNGTTTAYNTSSDYRLKENVTPLSGAADRLAQIPVHRFNFIADPDKTVDGFLAHEVQAFVPECVTGEKDQVETVEVTDEDGNVTTETRPVYQGIDQSKLVPLLTAALQEALTKINALEARIVTLEGGAA